MTKREFDCDEVSIPYDKMIKLCDANLLNLGIDNAHAQMIASNPSLKPKKNATAAAFHLWNWVVFGVLGYSIYLSFTTAWWAFIPGIVVAGGVWSANKKANTENVLDAALRDEEFYEKIRSTGGWIYRIDESVDLSQ